MINPAGIPRIPGDMEVLARHATELSRVGPDFSATGQQVNSTWQQLAGVYEAPEVGQLLAATGPVQTTTASVGEDVATVGGALATYAATVKQIQDRLDALRIQAQDLVAEAEADKAGEGNLEKVGEFIGIGGDDDEYAERSNELTGQVNAQVAAFYEAQRVCANAVNALYGGVQYRANDGDGHQERGEYGYTGEQLDTAFEQGQELPWGSYAETDTGIVGGIWDGAKMFVGDLGALIGRDPVTGEWSWGTAGTAWKGLGTFVVAAGVYLTPGGAVLDQTVGIPGFERGQLGDTLLAAGKGIIAYDEWGKGDNARAGGMAGFNIVSAIVGTKGAGAALRGLGAGAKTSSIGAVSRAGAAMVRGGEFIGRLPTTESLVARVSQHLPHLRLPGNIPDVNVPHRVDTPNIDAPRADAPRVDTPNPGSVGDNLAGSNRATDTPTGDRPHADPPAHTASEHDPSPGSHDTPADHTPEDHTHGEHDDHADTADHHGGADTTPGGPDPGPALTPSHPHSGTHIPEPLHRDEPLPTKELDHQFRGENDPTNANRAFYPDVVEYMSPERLEAHRLFVMDGKLHWASDGALFDTRAAMTHWSGDGRAIFVMDRHGNLYASLEQEVGRLHHSSFLGGKPVASAGELVAEDGVLKVISRKSGHYRPSPEHQQQVREILEEQGIDVDDVIPEDGF